jgi:hypothetical protein
MPGNPREMITSAERRFPVRIRVAVPSAGLAHRYAQITAWLDENCGADGWAMTPSGTRGVLNDAISIYFADATLASAFVAGGVPGLGSKRPEVCSKCARMSRSRGSGRDFTGHRERGVLAAGQRPLKLFNLSLTGPGAAYLERGTDAILTSASSDANNVRHIRIRPLA